MSPNGNSKTTRVQRTLFDLDSFAEVTLVKDFPVPAPVTTVADALARLGNDSDALISIINDGLLAEERRKQGGDPTGWLTLNDEGEVGTSFSGTVADQKKVNALVLTMAKTVFGYNKDMTAEQKDAAKSAAAEFVRTNDKIRAGLKTSAALTPETADETSA